MSTPDPDPDELLTIDETMALLKIADRKVLSNLRYEGNGPRFVRVTSREIRYRRCDLVVWLESRTRTSSRPGA